MNGAPEKERIRTLIKMLLPLAATLVVVVTALLIAKYSAGGGQEPAGAAANTQYSGGAATGQQATTAAAPGQLAAPEIRVSAGFFPLSFPSQLPDPPRKLKVPILMFHHIGDPPPGADRLRRELTVPASDLDAMLGYLKQAGFTPVTETQLFQALYGSQPLPAKPVMLTFDDGYSDVYEVARPILEKYGDPATFYIITDKVGTPEYMGWEQIEELGREGMDIGSHTLDHLDLTTLSAASLDNELKGSSQALSQRLGHPIYWFCYPSGKVNAVVERALGQSGYLLATTTWNGVHQSSDAPFELTRLRMRPETGLAGLKELLQ